MLSDRKREERKGDKHSPNFVSCSFFKIKISIFYRRYQLCDISRIVEIFKKDRVTGVRYPAEAKEIPLASVFRITLRPIQPRIEWVLVSVVKRGCGVTMKFYLYLVPRSAMTS
jgi:hypothetical protein